jgi:hypothetical protein
MRRFENVEFYVARAWIRVGLRVDTFDILKTLNSKRFEIVLACV